jgi:hypothetical protein
MAECDDGRASDNAVLVGEPPAQDVEGPLIELLRRGDTHLAYRPVELRWLGAISS